MLILAFLIHSVLAGGSDYLKTNVKKLDWNGINVVWVKDDELPTYKVSFYFNDGAYSEKPEEGGITSAMMDLIKAGTKNRTQHKINQELEAVGTNTAGSVTHEFSTFSYSGLVEDMEEITSLVCDMWANPTFPEEEVDQYIKREMTGLQNMVISHGAVADRVFREVSLAGTPYATPMEGKLSTLKNINSAALKKRLKDFLDLSNLTIYLAGPEDTLKIEKIINSECPFGKSVKPDWKLAIDLPVQKQPKIYFLPMEANQAQIRIGRYLNYSETRKDFELMNLTYSFLGSGFTSELMQELRVKRGLTYGASTFAGFQRDYGRLVLTTSTRAEKVSETLQVIHDVLKTNTKSINAERFNRAKNLLKGQFVMGLEATSDYLSYLMTLDHTHRKYEEIYHFADKISSFKDSDVKKKIAELYPWDQMTIFVLGPAAIAKDLKKWGEVHEVLLKDYL